MSITTEFRQYLKSAGRLDLAAEDENRLALSLTKAMSDAPGYRKSASPSRQCQTCNAWLDQNGLYGPCEMFDFNARKDFTCDEWVPPSPAATRKPDSGSGVKNGFGQEMAKYPGGPPERFGRYSGTPIRRSYEEHPSFMDEHLWEECLRVLPPDMPPELPHLCGQVDGCNVVLVDGDDIKLRFGVEFVEGGNYMQAKQIFAEPDIGIDANMASHDWPFILYHELIEVRQMKLGLTYDEAHEIANAGERIVRERATEKSFKDEKRPLSNHPRSVAIDFDGTLAMVGHKEPLDEITPRPGAKEALLKFQEMGLRIILWTARTKVDEAIAWMDKYGLPYSTINENPDQHTGTRKVMADVYVDDRAVSAWERHWDDIAAEVITRIYGKPRQPVDRDHGYPRLYKLAKRALPELQNLLSALKFRMTGMEGLQLGELEALLRKTGGLVVIAPIKTEKRATEKVESDYNGNWAKLLDMVRASVAVDTLEEVHEAVATLRDAGAEMVRFPKDRFREPLGNGYRDMLVNYKLPCGMICEVQFHLKPMLIARERAKISYDVVRAIKASMAEEGRSDLTPAEAEAVRRARKDSERMFARAWEEAGGDQEKAIRPEANVFKAFGFAVEKDKKPKPQQANKPQGRSAAGQPCKRGQSAARTGCIPAAKKPPAKKPGKTTASTQASSSKLPASKKPTVDDAFKDIHGILDQINQGNMTIGKIDSVLQSYATLPKTQWDTIVSQMKISGKPRSKIDAIARVRQVLRTQAEMYAKTHLEESNRQPSQTPAEDAKPIQQRPARKPSQRKPKPEKPSVIADDKPIKPPSSPAVANAVSKLRDVMDSIGQEDITVGKIDSAIDAHKKLTKPQWDEIVAHMGISGKPRSKTEAMKKVRQVLMSQAEMSAKTDMIRNDAPSRPENTLPVAGKSYDVQKAAGTCKPGERADLTGCTPASRTSGGKPSRSSQDDPAANRPSRPEERHPGNAPKALSWSDPPPKTGKAGGGQIKRPVGDNSQTAIGDLGEKMASSLGFRNILPEGKRSFTPAEVKQMGSSIDLEFDHSGKLYELKLCNTTATEYRLKAKAEEKEAKLKFARKNKAKVYTLVGVRDVDKGEIHFYSSRDPGLTGAEVNPDKFVYLGKVKYAS